MMRPKYIMTCSIAAPISTDPTTTNPVPTMRPLLRPIFSAVAAARSAPNTAPTSYMAVMVPTMSWLGLPIWWSQYLEMMTPDMAPWS
jgi:hypothetical protein